jgi:F0F1-type ATP synthase membrane subunit a
MPVAIILTIIFVAVIVFGLLAGPLGRTFGISGLPSWMSLHLPEPKLPADVVFHIFGFGVTNTILATWITVVVLVLLAILITRKPKLIPSKAQSAAESLIGYIYDLCVGTAGEKDGRKFFPFVATIFLFVLFNALLALIPGFGSLELERDKTGEGYTSTPEVVLISTDNSGSGATAEAIIEDGSIVGIHIINEGSGYTSAPEVEIDGGGGSGAELEAVVEEGGVKEIKIKSIEVLRGANTDFNTPLTLALITFLVVEFMGFKRLGLGYLKKFITWGDFGRAVGKIFKGKFDVMALLSGFILGIVGILELISELIRVVSLTFRLFGNMLAGEIVLLVIAYIVPYVIPLVFYGLEAFFAVIQALIFAALAIVYISLSVTGHEASEHH